MSIISKIGYMGRGFGFEFRCREPAWIPFSGIHSDLPRNERKIPTKYSNRLRNEFSSGFGSLRTGTLTLLMRDDTYGLIHVSCG